MNATGTGNNYSAIFNSVLKVGLVIILAIIGYWARHIELRLERIETSRLDFVRQAELRDLKSDLCERIALFEKVVDTRLLRINTVFDQLSTKIDRLAEHK